MRIFVFDAEKNVVTIQYEDILNVKRIKRRLCYLTEDGLFYGANTLEEFAQLHASLGFRLVDKKNVINMNHVNHIIKGIAYVRGVGYPIARRRLNNVTKYLDDLENNRLNK
jgi:hypothetical protein